MFFPRHLALMLSLLLAACSRPPVLPELLGPDPGWQTGVHGAIAYARRPGGAGHGAPGPLHVYIEGDGFAWVTRSQPSGDPTPRGFSALQLARLEAAANPAADILYLGRPCQYLRGLRAAWPAECTLDTWTATRFQPATHALLAQAFDALVPPVRPVLLIGYSGGAAHALQLAVTHPQVAGVISIAGNLAPDRVNQWHHVTRHPGDLAPLAALAGRIPPLPLTVVTGGQDAIITPALNTQLLAAAPGGCPPRPVAVPRATHQSGWNDWWSAHAGDPAALLPSCKPVISPAFGE